MRSVLRLVLLAALLGGAAPVAPVAPVAAQAAPVPGPCVDGTLPHGALSRICVPASGWNGDLVVWAHGYVDFTQPKAFYHLELPDGTPYTKCAWYVTFHAGAWVPDKEKTCGELIKF